MNHIKRLQQENKELKNSIEEAIEILIGYQGYFNSSKFQGFENNQAHVTTDVYPKLNELKNFLSSKINSL